LQGVFLLLSHQFVSECVLLYYVLTLDK